MNVKRDREIYLNKADQQAEEQVNKGIGLRNFLLDENSLRL
jgi:hypothetical protein